VNASSWSSGAMKLPRAASSPALIAKMPAVCQNALAPLA
jgi:hypothetical protein